MSVVPESDLRDYAAARALDHRGNATQAGWMAALGMSEELQFNILRGTLPGGEHGIVFHDVKVVEDGWAFGTKYMTQIAGNRGGFRGLVRELVPGGELLEKSSLFKFPHTTAAIRLPEASGLVVGLMAGREPEGRAPTIGQWHAVEGGPRGWVVGARSRGDAATVDELVRGPLTDLLARPQPTGFAVALRFGTLAVSQAHFAYEPEALDELCEKASWLAREIRAVCERHAEPLAFDAELPEPFWLPDARSKPKGDTFYGGDYQNLGSVLALADQTGMRLEDAFAFMRGFPYLPVPGEVFGVLRGVLPGSDVHGRVVVALERSAMENKPLQKALEHPQGGPFGCDTVLVPVDPATPETPGTEGEPWIDRGRVAVRRGVLAAWRTRERVSVQRHEVEALVADTLRAVRERGLTW